MWYYSLIIMCGMFVSYNWIAASVTTLIGLFTFFILDAMLNYLILSIFPFHK